MEARDLAALIRLRGCSYPRQKPVEYRFIGLACWLTSFGVEEIEKGRSIVLSL
jgi:hypothetical protein